MAKVPPSSRLDPLPVPAERARERSGRSLTGDLLLAKLLT
jgi:hypothetical protein